MKINKKHIELLKQKLSISINSHIVAIRGCSCKKYGEWQKEIDIEQTPIDHESMNCLFIVFKDDLLLPLKGSTSPHKKYIEKGLQCDGNGVNQLEIGFYRYYAKGLHYPSKQTAHSALRQTRNQPVRRSADNLDFNLKDRIVIGNVHDNIHASWSKLNSKHHASGGCQVISGYPRCEKRKKDNSGHWKLFHDHIYSIKQATFNYLLLPYRWFERIVNNEMKPMYMFGSNSVMLKKIQKYLGVVADGDFGVKTYKALIEFQRKYKLDVDGIIGKNTIKRLGL